VSDEKWTSPKNWYIDHEYLRVDGARLPLSEVRALVGSLLILEATTTERSRPDLSKLNDLADRLEVDDGIDVHNRYVMGRNDGRRAAAHELRKLLAEIESVPAEHARPDLSKLHALADQMHRAGPPHRSFARALRELLAEIESKP
jgi:hypothetical protein